jgi:hypothetical protein
MTTDEKRALCEAITQKLIARLGDDIQWLKAQGIGVTLFAFTFDAGALAYISTANREDMINTLKEWVALQEVGITTEAKGERARG